MKRSDMKFPSKKPRASLGLTTMLAIAFFTLSASVLLISSGLQIVSNVQTQREAISNKQQLIAHDATHLGHVEDCGTMVRPDGDASTAACSVLDQDCPMGSACHLSASGNPFDGRCAAAGSVPAGKACLSDDSCVAGTDCISSGAVGVSAPFARSEWGLPNRATARVPAGSPRFTRWSSTDSSSASDCASTDARAGAI